MMYYYLRTLSGTNAGESIDLKNGEHVIGRSDQCDIHLNVPGVSKRHAKITVADRNVYIEDLGSSNGTYVNGVFVTRKTLAVGDKVVLPGVVFSLNVGVAEQQSNLQATGTSGSFGIVASARSDQPIDVDPGSMNQRSPKEQAQGWFMKNIQPVFDRLLLKYEWKLVLFSMLAMFGVAVTVLSGVRFTSVNHSAIKEEVKRRALLLAERMAEINMSHIVQNNEALLDVEKTRRQEGVRAAYVTAADGQILAPASDRGAFVPSNEWLSAVRTEQGGVVPVLVDGSVTSLVVSHPIPRFDGKLGRNTVGAMAVVEVGIGLKELHWSESLNIILTSLVLVLILVLISYLIIYRMTAQPFQDMNDEIDQVLKGNRSELRVPVKFLELESLTRSFNFLLNKIKTDKQSMNQNAASHHGLAPLGGGGPVSLEDDPSLRFMVENAPGPILILDASQQITLVSQLAEEMLMISSNEPSGSIVKACEDQTVLGNILEAEKEARSLNGIPYDTNFDVFGKEFRLKAVAGFDDLGEHMRTIFVFAEVND